MPMTPIQARQALQQRGLPLTAENLNRMMAASYGMDDVPLPNGSASEGPMIDTSIADDDEQRSAAPMTPPTPPRRGADVVSSNPTPQAPPPVQPPPVNAAVPAPPAAVDNISPDDPADAGDNKSGGLSISSAPAVPGGDPNRPTANLGSPVTVSNVPGVAGGAEYNAAVNAPEPPSPVDALMDMIGNVGVSRADPVAGPDQGFPMSPAQMLMQQIMRMFQNQPQTPQQSPAMGGPPRRS